MGIAPLLKEETEQGAKVGNDDWENWYHGMIPLGVFVLVSTALVFKRILTWKDPLEEASASAGGKAFRTSDVPNPEEKTTSDVPTNPEQKTADHDSVEV